MVFEDADSSVKGSSWQEVLVALAFFLSFSILPFFTPEEMPRFVPWMFVVFASAALLAFIFTLRRWLERRKNVKK